MLAPHVGRVVAVDESASMLRAAESRLSGFRNVEFRAGELEELPIASGELDAAVLSLVLHHLAEPTRVLEEARRTLRGDGRLLIIDMRPHDRLDFKERMGHVWLGFAEEQVHAWLGHVGFSRIRIQNLTPAQGTKGPRLFAATARRCRSPAEAGADQAADRLTHATS